MGELKVHTMAHLGFHRGAQKDKDKERGPPARADHQQQQQQQQQQQHERRKHEHLQKEFQSMIPGTPAPSAVQSQAASQLPSRGSSLPASRRTSPFASPPASQGGSPPLSRTSSYNSVHAPVVGKLDDVMSHGGVAKSGPQCVNQYVPYHGEHQPSGTLLFTAGTGKPPRLEVYDIGNERKQHWHHLRPARRQEKLSRMLKDFFKREPHHDAESGEQESPASSRAGSPGAGPAVITDSLERDRDAAEAVAVASRGDQPPTLLAGIDTQLRNSETDPAEVLNKLLSQHKVADPTLVQRYGQLSSVVGKGSFGVVRLAQKADPYNKNRKLVYAVKEFHPNSGEPDSRYLKRLASEFCLASSLHNVNIIHTLDLLREGKSKFCGVMEYCAGGDLYSLIVVAGKLEPIEADCFFKQIMRGVSYMHEMGVAHRDLKPENILLTSRGCCKLTDFGNAECFRMAWEKEVHMSSSIAGSGPYIAPEEYKKSSFDPRAVDVWAAGVIYMAMSTGRHLWREAKISDEFYAKYLDGRKGEKGYEPIERLKMAKRRNVIYSVLDPVAGRRLTARQVLNSEWGREICVCEAGEGDIVKP